MRTSVLDESTGVPLSLAREGRVEQSDEPISPNVPMNRDTLMIDAIVKRKCGVVSEVPQRFRATVD